jgi:hypothetical protein
VGVACGTGIRSQTLRRAAKVGLDIQIKLFLSAKDAKNAKESKSNCTDLLFFASLASFADKSPSAANQRG